MLSIVALLAIVAAGLRLERLLKHQSKVSAQRATLEFISKFEIHDPEWIRRRKDFRSLRDSGTLVTLAALENGQPQEDALNVSTFLNYFEIVAIGINNGALDKGIYEDWFRSLYVRTWREAASFVIEWRIQRKAPRAFIAFEALANEWDTTPDNRA